MLPASHWVANLVVSHLLSIVGLAMGALFIGHLLAQRRPAGSTFAWLLAIILIPYVGVPLYIVFGDRKLRRQAATKGRLYSEQTSGHVVNATIARMLAASGAPPPTTGNSVLLLRTGEEAFAATMELINSAKETLAISTLILADDEVGRTIIERLQERAREGVIVRLLLDSLFGFRSRGLDIAGYKQAGGRMAWFMPVWHVPFRGHANLRLHRKVVIADGREAVLGGMNLASEYMGPTAQQGRWRDVAARVRGPSVADMLSVFAADWRFASGEALSSPVPCQPAGAATIQVIGSGPDVASDLIYDAFISSVFEARNRLWITTPYFVPDEALARAIVLAVRRGVDVRVLVPAHSNHLTADLAGAIYLREIVEAGGRVCCYEPGMMHGKVVVVDDKLAVLGSANLDMRSLFLNYEIALFFSSKSEIDELSGWFESLLPSCGPLAPASRGRSLVEGVARLFGPLA